MFWKSTGLSGTPIGSGREATGVELPCVLEEHGLVTAVELPSVLERTE